MLLQRILIACALAALTHASVDTMFATTVAAGAKSCFYQHVQLGQHIQAEFFVRSACY